MAFIKGFNHLVQKLNRDLDFKEIAAYIMRELRRDLDFSWSSKNQEQVVTKGCDMDFKSVYDRDVYFLIDASGSMTLVDYTTEGQTRFDYLKEILAGYVHEVINPDPDGQKISGSVGLYFFNLNQTPDEISYVENNNLEGLFAENPPTMKSYIAPAFEYVKNDWLAKNNQDEPRKGLIVIFTDGIVTDETKFYDQITLLCRELVDHNQFKILILGLGAEILAENVIERYLRLDLNASANMLKDGFSLCNNVIFDLVEELRGGLKSALKRQLNDRPEKGLPLWLPQKYPALFKRLKREFNL
jgi:hypothetical protein